MSCYLAIVLAMDIRTYLVIILLVAGMGNIPFAHSVDLSHIYCENGVRNSLCLFRVVHCSFSEVYPAMDGFASL